MTLAWHFAPNNLLLPYGDDRPIVAGETLTVDPDKLNICNFGLHASEKILHALKYGAGFNICRVELSGKILSQPDKLCASERKCLWIVPGEKILRDFARWCALQVIHLWNAPAVVREFLETGKEELRAAAWAAAWDAAGAAARAAAGDAARAAARDAAWAAAWDAAWDAAGAAARAAAWAAARDAAWAAAWAATRDAAWAAARDAQEQKLVEMVTAEADMLAVGKGGA